VNALRLAVMPGRAPSVLRRILACWKRDIKIKRTTELAAEHLFKRPRER
jgi:hypothetical protein